MNLFFLALAMSCLPSPNSAGHAPQAHDSKAAPLIGEPILRQAARELDSRVHYDLGADGALWSRGAHWKMRFDGTRSVYFPLFGARQPQPTPITLTPVSVQVGSVQVPTRHQSVAVRHGDVVQIDRGSFIERYDLTSNAVEQSFVFGSVPQGGDLVISIAHDSVMGAVELEGGIEWQCEFGRVSYSSAVAIDARGARVEFPTRLRDGKVELRVPQEFLIDAQAPLVIDPIVQVSFVTGFDEIDIFPDLAYDVSTDSWILVWERSDGADGDVAFAFMRSPEAWGVPSDFGYVNLDDVDWSEPKVANNNAFDTFFVVAGTSSKAGQQVQGRIISAWDGIAGNVYLISDGLDGEACIHPDVGGDPTTGFWGSYCVVFERVKKNGDSDIYYRLAVGTGKPINSYSSLLVQTIYPETVPSISNSNDSREWAVAYKRIVSSKAQPKTEDEVYAGRIRWNGAISGYPVKVGTTKQNSSPPTVSPLLSTGSRFAVTFTTGKFDAGDVMLVLLDGYKVLSTTLLRDVEKFTDDLGYAQTSPNIECDGQFFTIAYIDGDGQVPYPEMMISTVVWNGSTFQPIESREAGSPFGAAINRWPSMASKRSSGGAPRELALFHGSRGLGNNSPWYLSFSLYRVP